MIRLIQTFLMAKQKMKNKHYLGRGHSLENLPASYREISDVAFVSHHLEWTF